MVKRIKVRFRDNSIWDIPLLFIAEHRAKFYANEDPDTTFDEELEFALEDEYVCIDRAQNNMDWSDVKHIAKRIEHPILIDYDEKWCNADMHIFLWDDTMPILENKELPRTIIVLKDANQQKLERFVEGLKANKAGYCVTNYNIEVFDFNYETREYVKIINEPIVNNKKVKRILDKVKWMGLGIGLVKEFEIDTEQDLKDIQKQVTKELLKISKDYIITEWMVKDNRLRIYVYLKGD